MRKMNIMVQRSVVVLLVMFVVLVGLVRAEDAKEVVVGSAKEVKGITAKKITWEKDGDQMALIASDTFETGDHLDNRSDPQLVYTVALDAFMFFKCLCPHGLFCGPDNGSRQKEENTGRNQRAQGY